MQPLHAVHGLLMDIDSSLLRVVCMPPVFRSTPSYTFPTSPPILCMVKSEAYKSDEYVKKLRALSHGSWEQSQIKPATARGPVLWRYKASQPWLCKVCKIKLKLLTPAPWPISSIQMHGCSGLKSPAVRLQGDAVLDNTPRFNKLFVAYCSSGVWQIDYLASRVPLYSSCRVVMPMFM
jgi:hypothetical protein